MRQIGWSGSRWLLTGFLLGSLSCAQDGGPNTSFDSAGAGGLDGSGGSAGTAGVAGQDAAGGAGGAGGEAGCSRFATDSPSHSFGPGQKHGQNRFPENVLGPPLGGGTEKGSLDVVSLGVGGTVTVEFGDTVIVDGPGADFIIFENAFYQSGDETRPFAELAQVEVSEDGSTWHAFPCTAESYPFSGCAGWRATLSHPDNDIDPTDPTEAGGDPFDLADLGVSRARYVRITDRADIPQTVFDLDAVSVVNGSCHDEVFGAGL